VDLGKVYDITDFLDQHPGGHEIVREHLGQDVTDTFHSPYVHDHSDHAVCILEMFQIGTLH